MSLVEINFDGIVGPTHNYAGLSLGNLAATAHAGRPSYPREAALQGLAKMRGNMDLGLSQGFFVPLPRPNHRFLASIAADETTDRGLLAAAWSASSMWTANAATISPAPDSRDGRCQVTPANLVTMPHRFQEWQETTRQLNLVFSDSQHFCVHRPTIPTFGDEGAANHMRMCISHDQPGLEIFVYGKSGGAFPARQHEQASRITARMHALNPDRVLFVEQNPAAIAAGAFHNDVVAVANETVLFTHELAFVDPEGTFAAIREKMPEAQIIVVPDSAVNLAEAIRTYLFNAQLVTLPSGEMALVIPMEAWESTPVRAWLDALLAGNGPIRQVIPVNVKQSMANGGGPACLRLRVVADPDTVDTRFLLTDARADRIAGIVEKFWPEQIDPVDLGSESLERSVIIARDKLLGTLNLQELS